MEAAATLGSPERLPVPFVRLFNQHIVGMPIMRHMQFEEPRIQQGTKQTRCPQSFPSGSQGGGTAPPAQTPHSQITPVCTSWIRGPRDAEQPRRIHWSVSLS